MKKKYATMSPESIKKAIADGWKIAVYGTKSFIEEVAFTKENLTFKGFAFMPSNGLRQRELKSLVKRIQKINPKIKIQ